MLLVLLPCLFSLFTSLASRSGLAVLVGLYHSALARLPRSLQVVYHIMQP